MRLEDLRDVVRRGGVEPTALELAETLWLATQMAPAPAGPAGPPHTAARGPRPGRTPPVPPGDPATVRPAPRPAAPPPAAAPVPPHPGPRAAVELHPYRPASGETRSAQVVEIPKPIALGERLDFQRALRPLMRRVPTHGLGTLDEEETARRAAEHPVGARWPAVMRPPCQLWLDMVVIVDDGDSMAIWQDMADDIVTVLRESGVFRQVTRHRLGVLPDGTAVVTDRQGQPVLPRRLVDPANRRLILVVSDCVGAMWHSGSVGPLLHAWAARGPVAIVQPLPERLWARTGTRTVAGTLGAPRPCAPNSDLGFTAFGGRSAPRGTLVPVLEAGSRWLRRWTALVAGGPPITAAVTGTCDAISDEPAVASGRSPSAEQRVQQFRAAASREAFQLARYVALGEPQLDVIRYVQHAMLRPAQPAHLAEFLLSGLLRVEDSRRGRYRFVEGVPELLLRTLTVSQTLEAHDLLERVSAVVRRQMAVAGTGRFPVLVPSEGDEQLAAGSEPFAITPLGHHYLQRALDRVHGRERKPSAAGRAEVDGPVRVGAVPRLAYGRQIRAADEILAAERGPTSVTCQVLAAPDGVGKTQLAVGLAERLWAERGLDLLVWVTATSRAGIVSTYALAAGALAGVDDRDPMDAANRFLARLAATGRRWLIVLDDLTDPDDLTGLWPPTTNPVGRTVVTTRRRDTALLTGRGLVDVGVFTREEASDYLARLLGDDRARLAEADTLAADLGYSPAALALAAAYLKDQEVSCAGYRERLRLSPMDRLHPDQPPVSGPCALAIEAAEPATGGLATLVLRLASLLDPHTIPTGLFTTRAALGHYRQRLGRDVDVESVYDALRVLDRLGLTTSVGARGGALAVHALVQRAVREATPSEDAHPLALTAADALVELWPSAEHDPDTGHLRANIAALAATTRTRLWRTRDEKEKVHPALFHAGNSLGEIGLVAAAHDHYQDLHTTTARLFGPDHPDTLATRNNLAHWQGRTGDTAGAATAFELLLADRLRVLGPDHLDTLATRHSLAHWRGQAGDAAGAAAAYEQLLADRVRVLGPDHPDTLATRGNLARWQGQAGDAAGAAAALEQLLAGILQVLGPDHPHTLATRHSLAYWRGQAGDAAGAAGAFEQLLADAVRILGPDHPHTLATRGNLARWQGQAGDAAGAAAAYEQLLPDAERVLGPDHPDTLAARGNLARWRGEAGDAAGAAAAYGQLLADRIRMLGPDHLDTLSTRGNLARWQRRAGDSTGATAAMRQLLADVRRVLGPDHPLAEATRRSLARWQPPPVVSGGGGTGRVGELWSRADAGDGDAARQLAGLLAELGRVDQLRARADAGDRYAAWRLVGLLAGQGRVGELRARADAGDSDAAWRLAELLAGQGRVDEAVGILQDRPDDPVAASRLAALLAEQGRVDELRARADAGDRDAAYRLAGLLASQGDLDEATRILRARADAGDRDAAYRLAGLLADNTEGEQT